jgi:PAS domain-containing protein
MKDPMTQPTVQTYLRGLFDNLTSGVLIADDSACYVDANRAACALLDRPLEGIVGHHVSEMVAPGRVAEVNAQWQAFLRDGSQSGVFAIVLSDGTSRQINFQAQADFVPGLHLSFVRLADPEVVTPGRGNEFLTLCAWTKQVRHGREWIPIEDYLRKEHGVLVSHGISPRAFAAVLPLSDAVMNKSQS